MEKAINSQSKPLVLAGPCVAESEELLREVVQPLRDLAATLEFDLVFKASFDKANRSSRKGYRGPDRTDFSRWFRQIKDEFGVPLVTDVHETDQVSGMAEICDWLQIPAFLCRQTDLVTRAVDSGRHVNVKKGQFLAPEATAHIIGKVSRTEGQRLALTERGTTFGYHNYVVDMRSFPLMAETGAEVLYDVTHSVQIPTARPQVGAQAGGERFLAPALARAATATGYLNGFFLEVHPNPTAAKSDGATQLSIEQASVLLNQVVHLQRQVKVADDRLFRPENVSSE